VILTSDGDAMKFDPRAGELAVGDRNGFRVERVHAGGKNPPLTGQSPCLKFLIKLYDISGGGHPEECRSAVERQIHSPGGNFSLSGFLP